MNLFFSIIFLAPTLQHNPLNASLIIKWNWIVHVRPMWQFYFWNAAPAASGLEPPGSPVATEEVQLSLGVCVFVAAPSFYLSTPPSTAEMKVSVGSGAPPAVGLTCHRALCCRASRLNHCRDPFRPAHTRQSTVTGRCSESLVDLTQPRCCSGARRPACCTTWPEAPIDEPRALGCVQLCRTLLAHSSDCRRRC